MRPVCVSKTLTIMNFDFFRKSGPDTTNRKILRAAVIVGLLGLIAKLTSTVKELIVARFFGRGDEVDAFLIAFVLPAFILNIGMSALGSALVPAFVETRQKQGIESARRLFSSMMRLGVIALVAVATLLGLAAPFYLPFLGHSFSPAKLELTRKLLYLLLPWIIFSGIANLAASILNAGEKFALPALIPMCSPLITLYLVCFHSARWGVLTLAAGAVAGSLVEAMVLLYLLRRQGLRFNLRWYGMDAHVRAVLAQYLPMLTGSILVGGTAVVDQSMAGMLPSGNVAALGYANKVIGGILSICALSLSTATLPYFSRMAAAHDFAGCRHTLKRYSLLVVTTTVPLTLVIISLSQQYAFMYALVRLRIAVGPTISSTALSSYTYSGLASLSSSGTVTSTTESATHWGTTVSGGTVYLATVGTGSVGGQPDDLIIGPNSSGNFSSSYGSVNHSVTNHLPVVTGRGDLRLSAPGVTSATTLSDVIFNFGTSSGQTLTGVLAPTDAPEPASALVVASGLLGMGLFGRRKVERR